MTDRDVERNCSREYFADLLRRLAEALEKNESFRIQVVNKRFTVPANAELSVEHEVEDGIEELELQLRWRDEEVNDGGIQDDVTRNAPQGERGFFAVPKVVE